MRFFIFLAVILLFSACTSAPEKKESTYYFQTESFKGLGNEIEKDDKNLAKLFGLPQSYYPWINNDFYNLEENESEKEGWLGITMKLAEIPIRISETTQFSSGIKVVSAIPGSPGDIAGFEMGDIIIGFAGERLINKMGVNLLESFRNKIQEHSPESQVEFEIIRKNKIKQLKAELVKRPSSQPNIKPHPELKRTRLKFKDSLLHYVLKKEHLEEHFQEITGEIRKTVSKVYNSSVKFEKYNPFRLSKVDYLAHYPMDLPRVSRGIVSGLEKDFSSENINISGSTLAAMKALDLEIEPSNLSNLEHPKDLTDYLERLLDAINLAIMIRTKILKDIDLNNVDRLVLGIDDLLIANVEEDKKELTLEEKIHNQKEFLKFLNVANQIDLNGLLSAIYLVVNALDLEILLDFKKNIPMLNRFADGWIVEKKENITIIETEIGKILIGGSGDNIYKEDYPIIIDLGGNDRYLNRAGGNSLGIPFSIVIDFSGDDVYISEENWSQGAGLLGGGFLIDLDGDDVYSAPHFSQGAGFWGIGILTDLDGSDIYRSESLSQGAASFGIGLLMESKGEDRYVSAQFAQGFGFVKGFGAIVESAGADHYFAGGVYSDFRDPEKSYVSFSQGFGFGARPGNFFVGASGGIGVLADASGNDVYVGDYFSQGSSYWFALGILADGKGHDKYIAGRYSQGAGIHLSHGILMDSGGDDNYLAYLGVSQGCGHDYGVGMLLDNGGNDQYIGGVISQGAGNDNGLGILNDNGGDDYYHIKNFGQGRGNLNKATNKGSFGIHFDTGGGSDFYSPGNKNEHLIFKTEWGIFADTN
jgi:hypothetical protein